MRVGKMVIDEAAVHQLISLIQKKKELRELSSEFIHSQLRAYFQKHPASVNALDNPRSKKYKVVIKDVRALLRRVYGLFRAEARGSDLGGLVKELSQTQGKKQTRIVNAILSAHSSTKERLPIYALLYPKLWKITGKPKRIIDLGCGLNPFSLPLMGLRSVEYSAYDLSMEEVSLLRDFFTHLHTRNKQMNGEAAVLDLLDHASLDDLPQADVCFLFKMTDVFDQGKGHKATEEVLQKLPCRFVVVSLATKTMSGKTMTAPRRRWMEWLCSRRGWKYQTVDLPNELFYVIEKAQT